MTTNTLEKYSIPEGDLMTRYKYYGSLGYPENPKANLRSITEFELYYANPSQFNDPFDCLPQLNNKDPATISEQVNNTIRQHPNALELVKTRRPELKECTDTEVHDALVIEMTELTGSKDYNRILFDHNKVLCLTRDPISMLMWSHYGNSHKGFALEFSLNPDLPVKRNLFPARVQYDKERRDMDKVEMINDVLHYKNPVWSYEKEDRIVLSGPGSCEKYHPELLSSVILGAQVDKKIKAEVSDAVKESNEKHNLNIEIYQVHLSDSTYKLHIPNHPYFASADSNAIY